LLIFVYAECGIEVTSHAGWSGRYCHTSNVLLKGDTFLMGGIDGTYPNEFWKSNNMV
jgi:hypothetical protein